MLGARIVVTGATGYVGGHLLQTLRSSGYQVVGTARSPNTEGLWSSGDICGQTGWTEVLSDASAVIHTAGVVHTSAATAEQYQRVNVEGTIQLAKQALAAGVQRFIYISSASVYGESSDQAFAEDAPLDPQSAYAQSKVDAEAALLRLFEGTPAQLFILRLPMVVGKNAPGNLNRLVTVIKRGLVLPLGSVVNQRSVLGLETLTKVIQKCLSADPRSGSIYNVADAPLSTPELIRAVAQGLGRSPRLLPFPPSLLSRFLGMMGKAELGAKMLASHYLKTERMLTDLGVCGVANSRQVVSSSVAQGGVKSASDC